jgi:hypothetical protein
LYVVRWNCIIMLIKTFNKSRTRVYKTVYTLILAHELDTGRLFCASSACRDIIHALVGSGGMPI